jgi:transposase
MSDLLSPREAAAMIGVQVKTLENWRQRGSYGLSFVRLDDGRPRYLRSTVEAWLERYEVVPRVKVQQRRESAS